MSAASVAACFACATVCWYCCSNAATCCARLLKRDVARLCKGLCGLLTLLIGVAGVAHQQLPDRIYRGVVEGLRVSAGGAHLTLDRVERIGLREHGAADCATVWSADALATPLKTPTTRLPAVVVSR